MEKLNQYALKVFGPGVGGGVWRDNRRQVVGVAGTTGSIRVITGANSE